MAKKVIDRKNNITCILGAGVSGLALAQSTGLPVYEAESMPGGICSSYYIRPGSKKHLRVPFRVNGAYRFEIGGGHWIFGVDPQTRKFIEQFALLREYTRRSAVYFSQAQKYVPYPIQNNLRFLGQNIRELVLQELSCSKRRQPLTMRDWLENLFGLTLSEFFFFPFHELYTAGLYKHIAPQDMYKTPSQQGKLLKGASRTIKSVGYNVKFMYPQEGLDMLVKRMAANRNINYNKRVVKIDTDKKNILFADGTTCPYTRLISTLALNKMMKITGLTAGEKDDPYVSVLVLNIGAVRGENCPKHHWLYVTDSKSGFHRIGFYSNVDSSFLPELLSENRSRVSLYVERAYLGAKQPSLQEKKYM
jgi:protoporphyrinogen oxidase